MNVDRRMLMKGTIAMGAAMTVGRAVAATPGPWTHEGVVKRGGGQLHWVAMGSGKPLVLMPKLGGWVADWRHIAPALATRFRVIAIDPPGHGGSTIATPPPHIQTLAESAAMVRAALSDLGIDRFSFVGNSLGGCIGSVLAALFPDDVERLVPVSSALAPKATPAELAAIEQRLAKDFAPDGRPLPRSFAEVSAKFGGMTREMNDEQNASRAAAGLWILPSERGVLTAGITDYLPRIKARTLLVYGGGPAYAAHRAGAMKLLPDVRDVTIPGSGAFVHQQKPDETAKVILDFLTA